MLSCRKINAEFSLFSTTRVSGSQIMIREFAITNTGGPAAAS